VRAVALILLSLVAASTASADESSPAACLDLDTSERRLACLDKEAASLGDDETAEPGSGLAECLSEESDLRRLDCYGVAIGPKPATTPADDAPKGRLGVDFNLRSEYRPGADSADCSGADSQRRRAATRLRKGGAAAGAGAALAITGGVLSGIALALASTGDTTDVPLGLAITGSALGTGGAVSLGAAGTEFERAWVHLELAALESHRCGDDGSLSLERR